MLYALTDADIAIAALQHLVHALGAERAPEDAGNRLGCLNVGFLSINASQALLLFLLLQRQHQRRACVTSSTQGLSGNAAEMGPLTLISHVLAISPIKHCRSPSAHPQDHKRPPKLIKDKRHGASAQRRVSCTGSHV